jgi:hypothetical protein
VTSGGTTTVPGPTIIDDYGMGGGTETAVTYDATDVWWADVPTRGPS